MGRAICAASPARLPTLRGPLAGKPANGRGLVGGRSVILESPHDATAMGTAAPELAPSHCMPLVRFSQFRFTSEVARHRGWTMIADQRRKACELFVASTRIRRGRARKNMRSSNKHDTI